MPGVPLATPPASTTVPVKSPLITAASLAPLMVMVTTWAVPSTVVAVNVSVSVSPDIERLHGRIVVVQRVGPEPGGCQRVAAEACLTVGEVDGRPGVVRIVDVGEIQVAGRGRRARRSVGNTAGLHHRAGGVAADHCGVVGAVDDDGDDLRSAVDRRWR